MLIDLSDRAKLRVTGPDRIRFLNGQLTNDIANLKPGISVYACALSAKGKLSGDLFVLFHLSGVGLPEAIPPEGTVTISNRFAIDGQDLLLPATLKNVAPKLVNDTPVTDSKLEEFRIEQGIPCWGTELSEDVIPNEAGLDERAVSYTKGCYLGQEIISRIKSLGRVNRHLRGIRLSSGSDLQPGDKLAPEDGKPIGTVTSACKSDRVSGWIGLAYLRRGFDQPGTIYPVSRSTTSSLIGSVE